MSIPHRYPIVAQAVCTFLLAACSSMQPTESDGPGTDVQLSRGVPRVELCHVAGRQGITIEVAQAAVAAHLAHGDYATSLVVSHQEDQPGDGLHFRRIGDAIAAARAGRLARNELRGAACRITISVSGGTYSGSATAADVTGDVEPFPLVIDVPEITLRGALRMKLDRRGRATGTGQGPDETILRPVTQLPIIDGASIPIIAVNAQPDGPGGDDVEVEGFVFQSGHDPAVDAGGQGVLGVRAARLSIAGNRFEAGFTESIDLRDGSGEVLRNHLGGGAGTCDICLAGPGRYRASGNYLLAGGIPGIVVFPQVSLPLPQGIEPVVIGTTAEVWADISNNEVHDHLRVPVGVGIRVGVVGIGVPNVHGTAHAAIWGNTLVNNRFGIILEAGFPVNGTERRGDLDVAIGWNDIEQSCQAKLYVSLARHTTGLGLNGNPWLLNATYRIRLWGDPAWADAWYANADGFGNTLIVNGQVIAPGSHHAYDAAGCPAR